MDTQSLTKIKIPDIIDTKNTGCEGEIHSWSEQTGEILFSDYWMGTAESQSGETLRSLCVYNYKSRSVIYNKLLPVDKYGSDFSADILHGRIMLNNSLIIEYRIDKEYLLPIKERQEVLLDEKRRLFNISLILAKSQNEDTYIIQPYNLDTKQWLQTTTIPRIQGNSLNLLTVSQDNKRLMFERTPSDNSNTGESTSPCVYELDLTSYKTNKVACGYQFQKLYKTPPNWNSYVYADFIDWY